MSIPRLTDYCPILKFHFVDELMVDLLIPPVQIKLYIGNDQLIKVGKATLCSIFSNMKKMCVQYIALYIVSPSSSLLSLKETLVSTQ